VKALRFLNSSALCIEFGQSSVKVLDGDVGLEMPLERLENGRLTASCGQKLTRRLREFLKRQGWQLRRRAWCAINARGVSLRRLSLPASVGEEFQRLLRLQIESEFPLPPDELAWGYRQLNTEPVVKNGAPAVRELLVVAVKREMIQEYSQILNACGLNPIFTLGALARSSLCLKPPGSYALLDMGRSHSELVLFENGVPHSLRIVPWGGENLTRSIEQRLAVGQEAAEQLKIQLDQTSDSNPELREKLESAIRAELDSLVALIQPNGIGQKLYLSGASARLKEIAPWLRTALGGGVECEPMDLPSGQGRSSATLGLKQASGKNGPCPLILQVTESGNGATLSRPNSWNWAAVAALLALGSFSLRYAEAVFYQPRLIRKLSEFRTAREQLPQFERELALLQYLKTNQPPYLEALALIAGAAPGTRIDSLSMNHRGELALRGSMNHSQQVLDFRSKLIDSGFFSTVTVEEQTPAPDRQKVSVRIAAQWRQPGDRKPTSTEVRRAESKDAEPLAKKVPSGAPTSSAPTALQAR
jgi:type IV pilus assembly protein PilM